jgi:hypothetical protein
MSTRLASSICFNAYKRSRLEEGEDVGSREQPSIDALRRSGGNRGNREVAEHVIAVAPRIPSICYAPQIFLELD